MQPEARAAMGRRARAFMAEHKTWEVQGRRIVEYIRKTMFGMMDEDHSADFTRPMDLA
jgi:hypothetical protein